MIDNTQAKKVKFPIYRYKDNETDELLLFDENDKPNIIKIKKNIENDLKIIRLDDLYTVLLMYENRKLTNTIILKDNLQFVFCPTIIENVDYTNNYLKVLTFLLFFILTFLIINN